MDARALGHELLATLRTQAEEVALEVRGDGQEILDWLEVRLPQVAMAVTEPGFMEVLEVETNSLLLKSGLMAVNRADALDARLKDMAMGALHMALRAAATGGV